MCMDESGQMRLSTGLKKKHQVIALYQHISLNFRLDFLSFKFTIILIIVIQKQVLQG